MRRVLSATLVALLIAGLLPLPVLAAVPVATADTVTTAEDTAVPITLTGTDDDADPLTFAVATFPAHGTLTGTEPNLTYTPAANFNGDDSFTFTATDVPATDAPATSVPATVSITVTPVNDAPVAGDDFGAACLSPFWEKAFPIPEDYAFGPQEPGRACSLDANDGDVDGDPLTFQLVDGASHGTATVAADGSWSYAGDPDFFTPPTQLRSDSFTYRVSDGTLWSDPATVSIHVEGVNDAPSFTPGADPVSVPEDSGPYSAVWAMGITAGPGETGQVVTFDVTATNLGLFTTPPSIDADGVLTFEPKPQWSGTSTVTVTPHDDGGLEDWGIVGVTPADTGSAVTFDIVVAAVNDAPTPEPGSASVPEDTGWLITLHASDVEGDATTAFAVASGPTKGTLGIDGTVSCDGATPNVCRGSAIYTPEANYHGPDSFTFTASDGTDTSTPATVSLTVTAVNDAPAATAQAITTAEDTAKAITLAGTDADGDPLTYTVTTSPSHGSLSGTGGARTYTPTANYNGPDSFTFTASDATATSAPATVSITVAAVNDEPVATAQPVTTDEDTATAITLAGTDVEGSALTYTRTGTGPLHGTLTGTAPDLTYTPAANYSGSDSFTFKVNDGTIDSLADATVSITINPVNDRPVCSGLSLTTNKNVAVGGTVVCTDVEGTALTLAASSLPSQGTVNPFNTGTGAFTYTPASGVTGVDSFEVTASDGDLTSNPATVSISVANRAPTATAQTVTTAEDTEKAITLAGTDADGDPLSFAITSGPAHGALSGTGAGRTYTPSSNYFGPDNFTFTVSDGGATSSPATVSITVTSVNDTPVATAQAVTTIEDTAKGITLAGSDVEGDPLTYTVESGPAHGTLSGTEAARTYAPAANYYGPDSFTFTASDGIATSAPATVSITVTAVNDEPVASAQAVTTAEDTAKAITMAGTDADGNPLTFAITADPAHGTLSGTGATRTYTPEANYNGADSFAFTVSDGGATSAPATVSITVTAVNDVPVATAQAVTTAEDTAKAITLAGADVEGSALTYSVLSGPAHGSLYGTAPDLTYTPAANHFGPDSFTFTVNDGTATSAPAIVSITVTPVNDAPDARTDGFTINATSTGTLSVLANDLSGPAIGSLTSEPADPIAVTSLTQGAKVAVFIAPGGAGVVYDVKGCSSGGDSFTYTVTDGGGRTDTATVFVAIARPGTNGLSSNPVTDTPSVRFITNSTIGSTVPARLSWCGVPRSGSSVRGYRVGQSTNGGSSYASTPIISGTTATSSTRNLAVGTAYRWRARTTDSAGRVGAYRSSLTSRIARYQESSAAISYTGPWARSTTTSASGGAVRRTSTAGATATITLTNARQFAIVGPRSSTRGSFEVWLDGQRIATVSERSSTTVNRRVLFVGSLATGVGIPHTVQVRAVGNGRIDLDAILTLI